MDTIYFDQSGNRILGSGIVDATPLIFTYKDALVTIVHRPEPKYLNYVIIIFQFFKANFLFSLAASSPVQMEVNESNAAQPEEQVSQNYISIYYI